MVHCRHGNVSARVGCACIVDPLKKGHGGRVLKRRAIERSDAHAPTNPDLARDLRGEKHDPSGARDTAEAERALIELTTDLRVPEADVAFLGQSTKLDHLLRSFVRILRDIPLGSLYGGICFDRISGFRGILKNPTLPASGTLMRGGEWGRAGRVRPGAGGGVGRGVGRRRVCPPARIPR